MLSLSLLRRRRVGEYSAQLVQERVAAAQHFCCHGEYGFRCLYRRGNRDLLNRYMAVPEGDDDDDDDDDDGDVAACVMPHELETKHVDLDGHRK